jgi:hypothetical protein
MIHQITPESKQELLKMYFAMSAFYRNLLNGRISRAYRIVSSGLVSRRDESTYLVTSSNGKDYTVTFNKVTDPNPGWQCTCPDCQAGGRAPTIGFGGGVQPTCKHIVAVMLAWSAKVHIPQADPPPAQAPPRNGRHAPCPHCGLVWQQCNCPQATLTGRNLPEPARITKLSPEAKKMLREMNEKDEARNVVGAKALETALSPGAGGPMHTPAYQFAGRRYGYGQ